MLVIPLAAIDPQIGIATTPNNWNTVGGGSWTASANWNLGHSPTTQEAAVIGATATSASTPVSITLDGNQTTYAVRMDATGGRAATIDPGAVSTNTLTLLSTDQTNDGTAKFFTITALNGIGNGIRAPIQLGNGASGSFTAMITSSDPSFFIGGGISESPGQTWSVRITGNSQGIVSYATTPSSYSGNTTVANGGNLRIDVNNALPSGAGKGNLVLEDTGRVTFLNATTLSINGLSGGSSSSVVTNTPGQQRRHS